MKRKGRKEQDERKVEKERKKEDDDDGGDSGVTCQYDKMDDSVYWIAVMPVWPPSLMIDEEFV